MYIKRQTYKKAKPPPKYYLLKPAWHKRTISEVKEMTKIIKQDSTLVKEELH